MPKRNPPKRKLPVGAEVQKDGTVHFRVWAPRSKTVEVVIEADKVSVRPSRATGSSSRLKREPGGYFEGIRSLEPQSVRSTGTASMGRTSCCPIRLPASNPTAPTDPPKLSIQPHLDGRTGSGKGYQRGDRYCTKFILGHSHRKAPGKRRRSNCMNLRSLGSQSWK